MTARIHRTGFARPFATEFQRRALRECTPAIWWTAQGKHASNDPGHAASATAGIVEPSEPPPSLDAVSKPIVPRGMS